MKKLVVFSLVLGLVGLAAFTPLAEEDRSDEPLVLPFDMGYRPFHYWDEDENPVGFGIDVSREIADRLGRPGIEVVDVDWAGIFSGLFAEKYEAIFFSMHITEDRADRMLITQPFMSAAQGAAVREEDEDEITSPEDMEGRTVGVNAGSVSDDFVTENQEELGVEITRFDEVGQAVMGLRTGMVDVVLADGPTVGSFVEDEPGLARSFNIAAETGFGSLEQEAYGMAFRPEDEDFRNQIDEILAGMKLDGTLQEIMADYEEYFGVPGPDNYVNVITPGYGTPGLPGHDPEGVLEPYIPEED